MAWLSDIHLNFLTYEDRLEFYGSIVENRPDAVLVGGDIAEAWSLSGSLAAGCRSDRASRVAATAAARRT